MGRLDGYDRGCQRSVAAIVNGCEAVLVRGEQTCAPLALGFSRFWGGRRNLHGIGCTPRVFRELRRPRGRRGPCGSTNQELADDAQNPRKDLAPRARRRGCAADGVARRARRRSIGEGLLAVHPARTVVRQSPSGWVLERPTNGCSAGDDTGNNHVIPRLDGHIGGCQRTVAAIVNGCEAALVRGEQRRGALPGYPAFFLRHAVEP